MRFLFGSFYVCKSNEAAKMVAFEFKCLAVNAIGDVYDPSGTLSGGESANRTLHTVRLSEIRQLEEKLQTLNTSAVELND